MSNPIHRRSVDRFMAMTDGREEVSVLASEYDALESENEALRSQLTDALNRQTCEGGQPYVCHTLATARSRLAEAERKAAVLTQVRRWLKEGAIIKATDPTKPVLEDVDGDYIGGMTITYPAPDSAPAARACGHCNGTGGLAAPCVHCGGAGSAPAGDIPLRERLDPDGPGEGGRMKFSASDDTALEPGEEWWMDVAGIPVKLDEWEPGARKRKADQPKATVIRANTSPRRC